MALKAPKIQYWLAADGQWYWHIMARNARVFDGSQEGLKNKSYMLKGAAKQYPDVEMVQIDAPKKR